MLRIFILSSLVFLSINCFSQVTGSFTDTRDGKTYKTVKIGNQIWFAENLNYYTDYNSWCYGDKQSYCEKYGRLYNWKAAKTACPNGWHLPSKDDFEVLLKNIGINESNIFSSLLSGGSSSFSALLGGNRGIFGGFGFLSDVGLFWSSDEDFFYNAFALGMDNQGQVAGIAGYDKNLGVSIRCLIDASNNYDIYSSRSENNNNNSVGTKNIPGTINTGIQEDFIDSRDKKIYKTVKIGNQIWMSENLNYNTNKGSWCYNNNDGYCKKYGRLYNFDAAKTACPYGWHLPSDGEWKELEINLGLSSTEANTNEWRGDIEKIGSKLKAASSWSNANAMASNESGFSAMPGGYRSDGGIFYDIEDKGYYWSSTGFWGEAIARLLDGTHSAIYRFTNFYTEKAISVRCLNKKKDSKKFNTSINTSESNTLTDKRDNKVYKTVKIGNQIWMAENLNYITSSGSWCYNNKNSNCEQYGRLYNWLTAMTACPKGWHLPSLAEWKQLTDYLGGDNVAGDKMKEEGEEHWFKYGGSNSSGFTALPGGWYGVGSFENMGIIGLWWTATQYGGDRAIDRRLHYLKISVEGIANGIGGGSSVRCIQDNETNSGYYINSKEKAQQDSIAKADSIAAVQAEIQAAKEKAEQDRLYNKNKGNSINNKNTATSNKNQKNLSASTEPNLAYLNEINFENGLAYLKSNGNLFTGDVVEMDNKNVNIVYKAEYKNGKKNGKETRNYSGNKKMYEKIYNNGELDGKCTYWHPNGKIQRTEIFKNGKNADGKVSEFYDDGKVKSEEYYLNDAKEGKQYGWYKSGQKLFEEYYINGIREKKYNEWFDNGQVKKTVTYLRDKTIDSLILEYDKSGQILKEGKYKNGLFEGLLRNIEKGTVKDSVFVNGRLRSISSFKNEKLDGSSVTYFESESIFTENLKTKEETTYENGLKNGASNTWYINGKKESEKFYTKGQLNGKSVSYYENGKQKSEVTYVIGVKENTKTTWFENGVIESLCNYKGGKLNGAFITYYKNGSMLSKINYLNDRYEGEYILYYDNGNKKSEGYYKEGIKNGTFIEYDNNGIATSKTDYKNNEIDKTNNK